MQEAVSRRGVLSLATLGLAASSTLALAASVSFDVPLTGAQQVPPVQTPATGTAHLTYDPATREVTWSITFSGLSSEATMAHFHGPAPTGKNAGVLIWLSKKGTAPTSPFTGHATLTPAQAGQFMAGQWYVNLHSKTHPAGEIRGQVMPPKA